MKLNFSDILGIIGIITSLVGIPSFVVARRARQRPELRFSTDFDVLLNSTDSLFGHGLYMTLDDHRIDSISRTRMAMWNYFGDTIRGSDILEDDPLLIRFEDNDQVLQCRVLSMSRKQIKLAASVNPDVKSCVQISFDFLDANDGGILEIIH